MLLPPIADLEFKRASAIPRDLALSLYAPGEGILVHEKGVPTVLVVTQQEGRLIMNYDTAKRYFNLDITETDISALDFLNLIGLKPDPMSDPDQAPNLAADTLEGYRWRPSEELVHNPETRKTFLIDALRHPRDFLKRIEQPSVDMPNEDVVSVAIQDDVQPDATILPTIVGTKSFDDDIISVE